MSEQVIKYFLRIETGREYLSFGDLYWIQRTILIYDEHDNETGYGITQLNDIHKIGRNEYTSSDPRYKKKTFAMRIGYDGAKYQGLFHINVQQSHYLL